MEAGNKRQVLRFINIMRCRHAPGQRSRPLVAGDRRGAHSSRVPLYLAFLSEERGSRDRGMDAHF